MPDTETRLLVDYYDKDRDFGSDVENDERAAWGRETLQAFSNSHFGLPGDRDLDEPEIVTQNLGDLLAYFMHFVGPERFDEILEVARAGYEGDVSYEQAGRDE